MRSVLAHTYALALEKLFSKPEDFFRLVEDIRQLNNMMDKETLDFFCSPLISSQAKKQVLRKALNSLPDLTKNFLFILIDKNQFHLWSEILECILKRQREVKKILVAQVTSAVRLEKTTLHKIQEELERFFNQSVEIETLISPELLGGIKVQAGGKILDDTLSFHLANMQKERRINSYASN